MSQLSLEGILKFETSSIGNQSLCDSIKSVIIGEGLKKQCLEYNNEYYSGIVNGILCVESNGEINKDRISKPYRNNHIFKGDILKGLCKIHIIVPNIQSSLKNLNIDLELSNDYKNPSIIEKNSDKLLKVSEELKKSKEISQYKNNNSKNTGVWLIYGNCNNIRHYLMIYLETDHSPDVADVKIKDELCSLYSNEYLNQFLTYKI